MARIVNSRRPPSVWRRRRWPPPSRTGRRSSCSTIPSTRAPLCSGTRISPCWRNSAAPMTWWPCATRSGEHVVFDGARHVPLMALPGMRERTVKIGSRGQDLLLDRLEGRLRHRRRKADAEVLYKAHTVPHLHHAAANLQAAVAYGLAKDEACSRRCAPAMPAPGPPRRRLAGSGLPGCCPRGRRGSSTTTLSRSASATTWRSARRWCTRHGVASIPVQRLLSGWGGAHHRAPVLRQGGCHPGCGPRPHGGVSPGGGLNGPHPCGEPGAQPHRHP